MNEKRHISGYPLIINYLGIFAILIGLILLIPLTVIIFYPEEIKEATNFFDSIFIIHWYWIFDCMDV